MNKIRNTIFQNKSIKRVIKNTGYLAFGSIFSKGLLMLVFVYVARILGPEQYGTYFTAFEFVGLVALFSRLGFDMTAIREGAKELSKVDALQNKLLPIRIFYSIFISIIGLSIAYIINYNKNVFDLIIFLLPLVIIGGAINSGFIEHFNTSFRIIENMKIVTIIQIIRTIIFVVVSFFFISISFFNIYVLATITLFSSIIALIFQISLVKKYFSFTFHWKIDFVLLKKIIRPVFLFGIVSILYMLSMKIDIQILSNLTNQENVGFYAAGWQINNIGVVFISALSLSLFPNSARLIHQKKYRKKLGLFIIGLAFIIVLISLTISYYSRDIILLLFGNRFEETIKILKILVWFIPIRILLIWGSQVLECGDFLITRVVIYIIPMIINIVLNIIFIPKFGVIAAAYVSVFSSFIMLLFVTFSALYVSRFKL